MILHVSDIDECRNNPCIHDGVCRNTNGSYICECPKQYTGKNCELGVYYVRIFKNRCQNKLIIHLKIFNLCVFVDLDECRMIRCQNNATCQNLDGSYRCVCRDGFEGEYCEKGKEDFFCIIFVF